MRSKNILSIAAFITAFAFSAAFAGLFITKQTIPTQNYVIADYGAKRTSCWKSKHNLTADKIETFLRRDIGNGRERDRKAYQTSEDSRSFAQYAEAMEEYTVSANDLNESELPKDFQIAWREHVNAWNEYSEFLKNSGKAGTSNIEHFNRAHDRYDDEITATWNEVLRVARAYDADAY